MIRAQAKPAAAAFAARLAAKAGRLAAARITVRKPEERWRSAPWLWPLFSPKFEKDR